MPAAPFAALCLLASPWTPGPVDVFLPIATFLTCMSQQFHAWAHMKKSELPAVVDRLQVHFPCLYACVCVCPLCGRMEESSGCRGC